MNENVTIEVGKKGKLKLGWLFNLDIVYCGMPTPESFSVSYMEHSGNKGIGMNLFFPKDTKTMTLADKEVRVIDVTKEHLIVQLVERR